MTDSEAWNTEEHFWKGSADYYAERLHPACVMVFPAPAGVLTRPAIIESLNAAPRWDSVDITERVVSRPSRDALILAYRATGRRGEAPPYVAFCSSTYLHTPDGWQLVLHQQTPS